MSVQPPLPPLPTPIATPRLVSRRGLLIASAGGLVAAAGGIAIASTSIGPTSAEPAGAPPAPAPTNPAATTPSAPTTTIGAAGSTTTTTTAGAVATDRVLVVLQLSGGNDALNTLVPTDGAYHDLRPQLALADDGLVSLPFTSTFGLHPSFAPLAPLLAAGNVGVVAGIGFDEPDRSHFKALDMWWTAQPGTTSRTGWLGRWLDATLEGDGSPMRAVGFGGAVPALRADAATSIGINEIAEFTFVGGTASATLIDAWSSLAPSHQAARTATDIISGLVLPADLTDAQPATERLLAAAALIADQPDVRMVHVTISGFDTHANQLLAHESLLTDVADGIARFQAALEASGDADRVLLVTTSEFGRRVAENGSGGTDHGKAGVQLVVGRGLTNASLFGALDLADLTDGDLRPVIDPRSLYASALDWLNGTSGSALTDGVLGGSFERLPFVAA